jgi:glutathione S-transferase
MWSRIATLLRQGATDFEDFLARGAHEGRAARLLKWQWLQHGIEAPGVADKVRLYVSYLHKMESSLADSPWLVGGEFSMADIALAPYVNRLQVLAMENLWTGGRLPRLESWFERIRARPTFQPSLVDWLPTDLGEEMRRNGELAWPQIEPLLRDSRLM